MHPILSVLAPERIATEAFTDATAAVTRLKEIYERNTRFLRDRLGDVPSAIAVRATAPPWGPQIQGIIRYAVQKRGSR